MRARRRSRHAVDGGDGASRVAPSTSSVRSAGRVETSLEQRASRLSTLNAVSRLVTARLRLEELLDEIVRSARDLLQARVVRLWVLDAEKRVFRLAAGSGDLLPVQHSINKLPYEGSLVGHILRCREVSQVEDVLRDPRWLNPVTVAEAGRHTFLGVPLIAQGEPVGVLSILAVDSQLFTDDDVDLMRAFAAQAAIAISNARLYASAERRAKRLSALSAASQVVTSSLELGDVLTSLVRTAKNVLDVDIVRFWSADERTGEMVLMGASDQQDGHQGWVTRMRVEGSLLGTVLTSGEVLQTSDVAEHPLLQNRQFVQTQDLHGYIGVPIRVKDRPFGVLVLFSRERRTFFADEVEVLQALGRQAAVAIENARLYEEQTRHATRLLSLHGVAVSALSMSRKEDLLRSIVEHAAQLTRAECGFVYLFDQTTNFLRPAEGSHSDTGHHKLEILRPGQGVAGRAFSHRTVYRVNDYQHHDWSNQDAVRDGLQAIMAAPITTADEGVGALVVSSHVEGHRFEAEDALLLELLAAQTAVGIQNMRMFDVVGQVEGLRELDRLKTEFLSTVSHELRTPLSYIHGYAELLMTRRFQAAEVLEMAREIHRGSSSMVRLVDDLLDISRIEAGQLALHMAPTRVEDVARSVCGVFGLQTRDHSVLIDLPEEPLPPVLLDPERLRQVLSNLLSNAIQYSPAGGEVRVGVTTEGEMLRIEVSDSGVGIPGSELERVFERFYRGQEALVSAHRGSGLGLAIVKYLVEAHGGRVGVRSRVNHGSTFWLTLPFHKHHVTESASPEKRPLAV